MSKTHKNDGSEDWMVWWKVQGEESEEIAKARDRRLPKEEWEAGENVVAVCLSGGGIRSATFNLGVLQALANKKRGVLKTPMPKGISLAPEQSLLERVDYLSTVSGGGYIGTWLTKWMHREGRNQVANDILKQGEEEPEAIHHLRQHSQYLSPQMGLLSGDTWSMAAIYVRNIFLLWCLLLPVLVVVMLVPRVAAMIVVRFTWWAGLGIVEAPPVFCVAVALQLLARWQAEAKWTIWKRGIFTQGSFLWCCWAPQYVAAVLFPLAWAVYRGSEHWISPKFDWNEGQWIVGAQVGMEAVAGLVWLVKWIGVRRKLSLSSWKGVAAWVFFPLVGALAGLAYWGIAVKAFPGPLTSRNAPALLGFVCFATPCYIGVLLLKHALLRGLLTRLQRDEEWEWNARAAGWGMVAACGWLVGAVIACFGPWCVFLLTVKGGAMWKTVTGIVSGGSAVATILLGSGGKTPANDRQANKAGLGGMVRQYALALAAPVFILLILIGTVLVTDWVLGQLPSGQGTGTAWMTRVSATEPGRANMVDLDKNESNELVKNWWINPKGWRWHLETMAIPWRYGLPIALLFAGCVLLAGVGSLFFDINRISLHNAYRNRIVRAFLGASTFHREKDRKTYDAFTGFNLDDNPRFCKLGDPDTMRKDWATARRDGQCPFEPRSVPPFHVISVTLNLTTGEDLAWQERQAASFTMSRLHCGAVVREEGEEQVGYRRSVAYGGGDDFPISVGTAVAVSGAAASPNMGYHSSRVVAFILSFFNVRLGAWLGNPRFDCWKDHAPRISMIPLLSEAFGMSTDKSDYVYLSDGGHFENLGLYEMVRRQCQYIIVSDAGSDEGVVFEDLGNAVRKIRIDFGAEIRLTAARPITPRFDPDGKPMTAGGHCMEGTIQYKDGKIGKLLYLKASYYAQPVPPGAPGERYMDVANYAGTHRDFPHHSTADQFFTESMFESYRALGEYIAGQCV